MEVKYALSDSLEALPEGWTEGFDMLVTNALDKMHAKGFLDDDGNITFADTAEVFANSARCILHMQMRTFCCLVSADDDRSPLIYVCTEAEATSLLPDFRVDVGTPLPPIVEKTLLRNAAAENN